MSANKATGWLLLAESYMYSASVLSEDCNSLLKELIKTKSYILATRLIPQLYVSIYNARHGIELYLKCLITIQNISIDLPKKYKIHNIETLYKFLKDGDNQLTPLETITPHLDGIDYQESIKQLESIVKKYANYNFENLSKLIDNDLFNNVDKMNMYFRYPDKSHTNDAVLKLFEDIFSGDYEKFVERNIVELNSMQKLTKEIQKDMESMIKITDSIGSGIAEYVSRTIK
ncbi:hypothetical protein FCU45_04975 [Sulfurimonas crateris]|uniref:HEPN domain-containing protein n=1 Tax=Sulfurimonas crateris TaxID=2574727 RepID=A0A4U2Z6V9_9BACT|nr:hypothetical protein [Sulfurimonas crateris]TKI69968.1 hypothetical protein FCU45_04975 [Sulfurimonas crateris]